MVVEQNGTRTGGALVEGENELAHDAASYGARRQDGFTS
jgi:hypothetical protein